MRAIDASSCAPSNKHRHLDNNLGGDRSMIGGSRDDMRRFFVGVWKKRRAGETLEPLEHVVAATIEQHPEFHDCLVDEETALGVSTQPADGAQNPVLHMGMHIALQEQLGADHPTGIRKLYLQAARRIGDAHATEHRMMDCLGNVLSRAQADGTQPDEVRYLECLKKVLTAR